MSAGGIATCGPQCRFGAVLFIEKEGFIPLFERVQLAERYDIAIMSTKGMSVTACRQLVEAMCASNVPLLVLHDFDKSGFSILGTLRSNTRRYSFRSRPNVIDLGLRLDDVTEFEDQAEDTFDVGTVTKRRENLRKNGATEAEIEFILHRRIELNALRSDQLIAFVERRLAEHGIRKIIPDKEILAREYRAKIRGREIEKIFAEMAEQDDSIEVPSDLQERVADHLKNNPAWSWDAAVCQIVFDDERHERD